MSNEKDNNMPSGVLISNEDDDVGDGQVVQPISEFDEMGLSDDLLRGIYGYGFEKPSMVQQCGIIPFVQGRDIICQAQSGTGKTGTFSIGVLSRIDMKIHGVQAIVLSPTRELAHQSAIVCSAIGDRMGVLVALAVGGTKMVSLTKVQVVIGTPGRIYHMLTNGMIDGSRVQMLVLDEADELLGSDGSGGGFVEQIRQVYDKLTVNTLQVGLFSATLPANALETARAITKDPVEVLVKADQLTLEGISQFYIALEDNNWKLDTLIDLYGTLSIGQSIIYVSSQRRAEGLAHALSVRDFAVSTIHGGMEPVERTRTMQDFRLGKTRVLVATDLLSRGIDVQGVSVVMNVDMPFSKEQYLHRIGRSGRFGRKGVAINLVSPRDVPTLREIEHFYATTIKEMPQNIADYM